MHIISVSDQKLEGGKAYQQGYGSSLYDSAIDNTVRYVLSMIARTDIITNSLAPHLNNVHPAPPLLRAFFQHSFLCRLQAHYTSRLPTRSAANRGVASSGDRRQQGAPPPFRAQ